MNRSINIKTTATAVSNFISLAIARRGFVFVVLVLTWLAFFPAPKAIGVTPAPDGGYHDRNTAEGTDALFSLTSDTGVAFDNTAIGFRALYRNQFNSFNTAVGSQALANNTADFNTAVGYRALFNNTDQQNTAVGFQALANNNGFVNTAVGDSALVFNTVGVYNTATGGGALFHNISGSSNTANGVEALIFNISGGCNTATGVSALFLNRTGDNNTATGCSALLNNESGSNNTATGVRALSASPSGISVPGGDNNTATGASSLGNNTTGSSNTATGANSLFQNTTAARNTAAGFQALKNNTGSNNIALGANAGINLTTGSDNIAIGAPGMTGESNTIRIGMAGVHKTAYMKGINGATVPSGVAVIVDAKGHLGTVQSSARVKDEIKAMDKASEAILQLRPVTFRYRHEFDPDGIPQFGLVAEEVEKMNPDLVARDDHGQVYAVRYEAVNAMLLNEFLKEHRRVQQLEAAAAEQQKEIKALTASIKEQAAQIQKVSAQLELDKPAPQIVAND